MPASPDVQIDDCMARLARQLKSLPAAEREEHLRELRQHLDALIAMHRELGAMEEEAVRAALHSFGDPTRIGRQMAQEWRRRQQSQMSVELRAVLFTLTVYSLAVYATHAGDIFLGATMSSGQALVALAGIPLLTGAMTGALFSRIAVPAVLYATASLVGMVWLPALLLLVVAPDDGTTYALKVFAVQSACWLPLSCLAAYGASALRRRTSYHVGWSDLKLTRL